MGQTLSVNQLVDMEWRFGVTASSNEVQRVGSSFLQLRLLINKGNAKEEVFMGECGCVLQFYFGFFCSAGGWCVVDIWSSLSALQN